MILTVTPNPAIDLDFIVNDFRSGGRYRANVSHRSPGGAGINISIILRRLGVPSIASGFLAGFDGAYILDALRKEGVATNFVYTKGETRVNVCIADPKNNSETRLIETDIQIMDEDRAVFLRNYQRILGRVDLVVMGGSLPLGLDFSFYAEMLRLAHNNSIPTLLYAELEHLQPGTMELATLVKLRQTGTHPCIDETTFIDSAASLHRLGTEWVFAVLEQGKVAFSTPKGAWIAEVPNAEMLYIYATGDALTSGLLTALQEKANLEATMRFATACYWECAAQPEKFPSSRAPIEERVSQVRLSRLS